jgi:hypothetical protein
MNELMGFLNEVLGLIFIIINSLIGAYVLVIVIFTFIAFVWLLFKYMATRTQKWQR